MCGTPVVPGTPAAAGGTGASRNLPWFIAGAALLALVVAIVGPRMMDSEPAPPAAPPITGPAAAGTPPDLSTMTPEEAATRLFNRVMQALAAGDTAQALGFVPMAISAYDMIDQIDHDALYHKAVLQLVNNDPTGARETAGQILAEVPTHLFGLFTAAQAENLMGNEEAAAEFYASFVENYDAELATNRPEYTEHEPALPSMRAEAEERANR